MHATHNTNKECMISASPTMVPQYHLNAYETRNKLQTNSKKLKCDDIISMQIAVHVLARPDILLVRPQKLTLGVPSNAALMTLIFGLVSCQGPGPRAVRSAPTQLARTLAVHTQTKFTHRHKLSQLRSGESQATWLKDCLQHLSFRPTSNSSRRGKRPLNK